MTRYFYSEEFVDDGEVKGPETIQRLRELRFENEITDLCKVCAEEEGEGNWTNLAELLGDGTAVVQADKAVEQEDQRQKELPPLDEAMIDAICNEGTVINKITNWNRIKIWCTDATDQGNWLVGIYVIVGSIFVWWGLYKYSEGMWDIPKAVHDMGKAMETPSYSNVWASRDIVSIEEIKTDASLNPIIGFGAGKNGRARPMFGALPESGKIQWKVTWRDSSGVLRSQVVNKYPSKY